MVGGVGWGRAFSRVFSGFSCSSSVFSPKAELKRRRRWESWRGVWDGCGRRSLQVSAGAGVLLVGGGVRGLCAAALKLCVLRSLPLLSLSPFSLSVSPGRYRGCCSWETVGGWEDRDGLQMSAGSAPGRWVGVGISGPVGVGAGCFLSCWGFFSLSGALGVSCCCWGFASPCRAGAGR